ncbi:MAG: peptidylprolyl isomerase [Oscillospiraceae bacterium]|nr:peptidylprolyl isomerase [Oscillospiraceae bacterium]
MKTNKFIWIILIFLSALLILSGCGPKENPKVEVEMENGGIFIIELYPEYAPKTVDNFVKLVEDGFYDGLIFHRVSEGFMAQGGGEDADGNKKPADSIFGEFSDNGYTQNTLKHTKGVISMARIGGDNNSASSEFFIMYDYPYSSMGLDGQYAAFGKVIEGMEVVEKFQEVEKMSGFAIDPNPTVPVEPIIIKKMTVKK